MDSNVDQTVWYPSKKARYEIELEGNVHRDRDLIKAISKDLWEGFETARDAAKRTCLASWVAEERPQGGLLDMMDEELPPNKNSHTWGERIYSASNISIYLETQHGAIFLSEYVNPSDSLIYVAQYAKITRVEDKILLDIEQRDRLSINPEFAYKAGQKYGRIID